MSTLRDTRVSILVGLLALSGIASACMTSLPPEREPRATSPYGENVRVSLPGGRHFEGELLAVTDSAWFLMWNYKVATIRSSALSYAYIKSIGFISMTKGTSPLLKQVRESARFPEGLPPGALAVILAKTGQTEPTNLENVPK
jgi:hypothetical protein